MKGYLIANYDITGSVEAYQKYAKLIFPTLSKYGGKLIIGDRDPIRTEGTSRLATVVIEFESVESAKTWYDSPEYQNIINLRKNNTEGWNIIAKEFVMPESE